MNKNNVKIGLGLIGLFVVNFLVFKIAVSREIGLIEIPVVKQVIFPRTKIEDSMIKMLEVPSSFVSDAMYTDKEDILNLYSDIQTMIPLGSPFYKSVLFNESELPDYPKILLKENQVVYTLDTNLVKLSGNSIVVNQKVDLITTYRNKNESPLVDVLVSSVRVIGVKDKKGIDVLNPKSSGTPHLVLLALDSDLLAIVRAADEIASLELFAHSKVLNEESVLNTEAKILEVINE